MCFSDTRLCFYSLAVWSQSYWFNLASKSCQSVHLCVSKNYLSELKHVRDKDFLASPIKTDGQTASQLVVASCCQGQERSKSPHAPYSESHHWAVANTLHCSQTIISCLLWFCCYKSLVIFIQNCVRKSGCVINTYIVGFW